MTSHTSCNCLTLGGFGIPKSAWRQYQHSGHQLLNEMSLHPACKFRIVHTHKGPHLVAPEEVEAWPHARWVQQWSCIGESNPAHGADSSKASSSRLAMDMSGCSGGGGSQAPPKLHSCCACDSLCPYPARGFSKNRRLSFPMRRRLPSQRSKCRKSCNCMFCIVMVMRSHQSGVTYNPLMPHRLTLDARFS